MALENVDGRRVLVGAEEVVLVKRHRVLPVSGTDRRKHVPHGAEPLGITPIAYPGIPKRFDVAPILVRRAIVEQRDLEIGERLCTDRIDGAAGEGELAGKGEGDRGEGGPLG